MLQRQNLRAGHFLYPRITVIFFLFVMITIGLVGNSYGHVISDYGNNKVAGYTISFTPVPTVPLPGETAALKFGMQDPQGNEVYNLFATVIVESLTNEKVVPFVFSERLYEFGDISLNYNFPEDGLYRVTLDARIKGGDTTAIEQYQAVATSFEVRVGNYSQPLPLASSLQNVMWVGFIAAGAAVGIYAVVAKRHNRKSSPPKGPLQ